MREKETHADRRIYSKILGREKDMNILELKINELINGQGSVVNIEGEAGVGKSRLIAEMKKREIAARTRILEGKATKVGQSQSFYPVRGFLEQWSEISAKDTPGLQLEKLEKLLRNIWPEQLGELLPFVAKIMGVKLSEKYSNRLLGVEGVSLDKLIIKNTRALLRKTASQKPLIIILDDMHWADISSILLLKDLFELAETEKIMFVNLFRPAPRYPETSGWLLKIARESYSKIYETIELKPLNEEDSEKMVDNLLRHSQIPATFKKQIVERSGGNPLFIEEIVRSFIDNGTLLETKGQFELAESWSEIVVTSSVDKILGSRLDELDKKSRKLLEIAAVIGRSFLREVLLKVADDVEKTEEKLLYLEQLQLIRKNELEGEVEYLFKHGLMQEVAYQSISEQNKKKLHLKAARAIEEVSKERQREFYGLVAYHYSQAGELNKALEIMLSQEAMKASSVDQHKNVLEIIENSGDAADPQKIFKLKKNITQALFSKGDKKALEYSEDILASYGVKLPQKEEGSSLPWLGNVLSFMTRLSFVIKLFIPALGWKNTPTLDDVEKFGMLNKRIDLLYPLGMKKVIPEVFLPLNNLAKLNISKKHPLLTMMVLEPVWFLNLQGTKFSLILGVVTK